MGPSRPPGRLIDVGGFSLHLNCAGAGSPAVIFDAALGGSSLSWTRVQPAVAAFARACSYDRAGFGWSEGGPMPRTAGRIADELRTLLDGAAVPPPYLLVGHSFGGLVMRIFAARHRADVAGLVLVEPAFPEDWIAPNERECRRIEQGARLCRYGAAAARMRIATLVAVLASLGALPLARLLVKVVSRGDVAGPRRAARGVGVPASEELGGVQGAPPLNDEEILAPIWKLTPEARRELKRIWTRPQFFEALGSQIETIRESGRETLEAARGNPLADLPLAVVSATNPHPHHVMMQERLAALSSRGRRVVSSSSGHWVPLDDPATVIAAIRDIAADIRGTTL